MERYGLVPIVAHYAEPVHLDDAKLHLRVEVTDDDALIRTLIVAARNHAEIFTGRALVTQTWDLKLDAYPSCIYVPKPPLQSVSSITYTDDAGSSQTEATSIYTVDTANIVGRIFEAYGQTWSSTRGIPNAVTVRFVAGMATPFTAAVTDTCTAQGRTFTNADRYRVMNSGGALPAGLSRDTDYFIISASGSTFSLSLTSGGAAVDITDTGSGTHFIAPEFGPFDAIRAAMKLMIGHWYENRSEVEIGTIATHVPEAAKTLLWQNRVVEFV